MFLALFSSPFGSFPNRSQGIVKGFTELGFKTQVQPLSSFRESYGLEADEDEGQDDDEEEDEDMEDVDGESGDDSGDE